MTVAKLLTEDELWEIQERDSSATEGPWESETGVPALLAHIAAMQAEQDRDCCRWQDAIRNKLIEIGAPAHRIDGAGCDSGDPLDFTLAEVGQGAGYFVDLLDETRTRLQQVTEERDRVRRIADKRTEVLVQARQHFAQSPFAALVNGGDGCVKRSVADYVKTLVDHATQLESQLAACEQERDSLNRTLELALTDGPVNPFRSQLAGAVRDMVNSDSNFDNADKRAAVGQVAGFIEQFQVKGVDNKCQ